MAIPETQLETWSHQGSIAQSRDTYKSIKSTLEAAGTAYADKNFRVFLQGSYGNDTNIYAESDVDVVICLDDCFQKDISNLTESERVAYENAHVSATYTHEDFKSDVLSVLVDQYGGDVDPGNKAVAIKARANRRKADVIVAVQFRKYIKFNNLSDQSYIEGICFLDGAGTLIANYPKQHSANLTVKHQASDSRLKPMVRILKNLRGRCVDEGLLDDGKAPSYYLEGLLYNVPSPKFAAGYQDCFINAFNWIQKEADKNKLVCANEQYYLLRDGYDTCWPTAHGDAFIVAAINLWNDW